MTDAVERVAKAMANYQAEDSWPGLPEWDREDYRVLARGALGALGVADLEAKVELYSGMLDATVRERDDQNRRALAAEAEVVRLRHDLGSYQVAMRAERGRLKAENEKLREVIEGNHYRDYWRNRAAELEARLASLEGEGR